MTGLDFSGNRKLENGKNKGCGSFMQSQLSFLQQCVSCNNDYFMLLHTYLYIYVIYLLFDLEILLL